MIETAPKGPRKTNGYTQAKARQRQRIKNHAADDRQAKYDSLSIDDKIKLVESRGGSKRELVRLIKQKQTPIQQLSTLSKSVEVVDNTPKRQSKKDVIKAAKENRPSKS